MSVEAAHLILLWLIRRKEGDLFPSRPPRSSLPADLPYLPEGLVVVLVGEQILVLEFVDDRADLLGQLLVVVQVHIEVVLVD